MPATSMRLPPRAQASGRLARRVVANHRRLTGRHVRSDADGGVRARAAAAWDPLGVDDGRRSGEGEASSSSASAYPSPAVAAAAADELWRLDPFGLGLAMHALQSRARDVRAPAQQRASSTGGGGGDPNNFSRFWGSDLPSKVVALILLIMLSRVGVYIPLPGVDVKAFSESVQEGGLLSYIDSLSGGSISKVGVFSLGIVPYINASIVFQLLTSAFPSLKQLAREEGKYGKKKFDQYQKYAALGFAAVQVRPPIPPSRSPLAPLPLPAINHAIVILTLFSCLLPHSFPILPSTPLSPLPPFPPLPLFSALLSLLSNPAGLRSVPIHPPVRGHLRRGVAHHERFHVDGGGGCVNHDCG